MWSSLVGAIRTNRRSAIAILELALWLTVAARGYKLLTACAWATPRLWPTVLAVAGCVSSVAVTGEVTILGGRCMHDFMQAANTWVTQKCRAHSAGVVPPCWGHCGSSCIAMPSNVQCRACRPCNLAYELASSRQAALATTRRPAMGGKKKCGSMKERRRKKEIEACKALKRLKKQKKKKHRRHGGRQQQQQQQQQQQRQ